MREDTVPLNPAIAEGERRLNRTYSPYVRVEKRKGTYADLVSYLLSFQ